MNAPKSSTSGVWLSSTARRLVSFLFLWAAALLAQAPSNLKIEIKVTDPKGQFVPGAFVELRADERIVRSGETDEQGFVSFGRLPAGIYNVTAARDGFEKARRTGEGGWGQRHFPRPA